MPDRKRRLRAKNLRARQLQLKAEVDAKEASRIHESESADRSRIDPDVELAELLAKADAFVRAGGNGGHLQVDECYRADCALIRRSILAGWPTPPETHRKNVAVLIKTIQSEFDGRAKTAMSTLHFMDERGLLGDPTL